MSVKSIGENISKFIEEENLNYSDLYGEIKRSLNIKHIRTPMIESKAVLISLCVFLRNSEMKDNLTHLVKRMDFITSKIFLQDFIELIAEKRKLTHKKAFSKIPEAKELIEDILKTDDSSSEENFPLKEQEKFFLLEKENEDFRAALQMALYQLDNIQDEIEILKQETIQEVVSSFFREMNSSQYSNLLDQFAISEKRLRELKEKQFKVPEEIEFVPASIRMFMKFVKNYGINSIETIGVIKKINLTHSELYEYFGTDFIDNHTEKEVEIISTGWQFKNMLISKPKLDVQVFSY